MPFIYGPMMGYRWYPLTSVYSSNKQYTVLNNAQKDYAPVEKIPSYHSSNYTLFSFSPVVDIPLFITWINGRAEGGGNLKSVVLFILERMLATVLGNTVFVYASVD